MEGLIHLACFSLAAVLLQVIYQAWILSFLSPLLSIVSLLWGWKELRVNYVLGSFWMSSVVDCCNSYSSHLMMPGRQLVAPGPTRAHGSAPDSQTKANGEGRASRLRGFTGHLQLLRCLLGFSACSRSAPLPLWAGMHLYASHIGVPNAGGLFQVSFRHWECNEQQWAAGVALCESSR